MTVLEMPCQELVEVITHYLDGTLPPTDRARFDEHLAGCGACTRYLRQFRETIITLRGLPDAEIPESERRELLTLFSGWRRES